jgi:PEP-CTERM motif
MKPTTPTYPIHPNWHRALAACLGCALYLASSIDTRAAGVVTQASGLTASDIQAVVDGFRNFFGPNRGNNGDGPFSDGFRNINWDGPGLPENLPGTFFNSGNALRGLLMTTPGNNFLVSANPGGIVEFGNIDPAYPNSFLPFSGGRIFAANNSTITDNLFFVPSSPGTAASVFGFGVVFTDVDIFQSTSLQFFDLNGVSLGTFYAPVLNNGLSFIGVTFNEGELIESVRITSGNAALGLGVVDTATIDVVAMDDFMYSEPQAVVPEPGTVALILLGLGGMAGLRRRSPSMAFA